MSGMEEKKEFGDIPRPAYEARVRSFIEKPLVKVFTGIRRAGKSSLMGLIATSLASTGVEPERIIQFDMESLENDPYRDFRRIHDLVKEVKKQVGGRKVFLFLDEVQEIPSWERLVNSLLADDEADMYISGSNARLLSGELASALSGRYVEFPVHTLGFREFADFRRASGAVDVGPTSAFFNEYLAFGGFPGIHRMEYSLDSVRLYLRSVVDSVVLKDVIMRNKVRDVHLLERILLFVSEGIGNVISARSIADFFKSQRKSMSIDTVYRYLSFLQSAFIIHRVPRFDLKGKRLLETHEKYYLADIGLRHALMGYRDADINRYLENIVYLELLARGYEVTVGKWGDLEVDFVASKAGERLYVQVAYLLADEDTRRREFSSLAGIRDSHPKVVLSMDDLPDGDEDGIKRIYLPRFLWDRP